MELVELTSVDMEDDRHMHNSGQPHEHALAKEAPARGHVNVDKARTGR